MDIYLLDDEQMALDILEIKLTKIFQEKKEQPVIRKFSNPLQLLNRMKEDGVKVDLLFLDIEMPEMNGIEFAEELLDMDRDIPIVFLTAYSEYAVKAFELYVLDYLLKPVKNDRLQKTIERIMAKKPNELSQSQQALRVRFLKNFEVYFGQEIAPLNWKTYKVKELFAYFLYHHNVFLEKDKIIDSLWMDTDYEKAKVNFYTCISYLRKMFRDIGYENIIHKNGNGYLLNVEFHSDVNELETVVDSYKENNSLSKKDYIKILNLYPGDYLEDNDYPWSRSKQEVIRNKYLSFIENKAMYLIEDDTDLAILFIKKAIQLNPYVEQYYQLLMKSYTKLNQKIEGINSYNHLKKMLGEEFNVTPSNKTEELYQRLKEL